MKLDKESVLQEIQAQSKKLQFRKVSWCLNVEYRQLNDLQKQLWQFSGWLIAFSYWLMFPVFFISFIIPICPNVLCSHVLHVHVYTSCLQKVGKRFQTVNADNLMLRMMIMMMRRRMITQMMITLRWSWNLNAFNWIGNKKSNSVRIGRYTRHN